MCFLNYVVRVCGFSRNCFHKLYFVPPYVVVKRRFGWRWIPTNLWAITPLQKYSSDANESANSNTTGPSIAAGTIHVPFLKNNLTAQNLAYWEARPILRKSKNGEQLIKEDLLEDSEQIASMREQIIKLKDQLQAKDSEVKRWQNVNNKLMSRLQTKS